MKKILILTHGRFAEGITDSLKMIAGEQDISTLCMLEDDSPQEIECKLSAYINQTAPEDDIIIITDIPGGSTTKSVIPFIPNHANVHVITGLNLALLLEVVFMSEVDIAENINKVIANSRDAIIYINDMMAENS